jgi:SAM-dependent methyltransferase
MSPSNHFVCPACKSELEHSNDSYTCTPCGRQYPVLFGIPDFRLRPDRYLTIEQDRHKAGRLHEYARSASFGELIRFYYTITDDIPPELAVRYQAYVHNSPEQARNTIARFDPDPGQSNLLDMGCGAGGFLVTASGCFKSMAGLDIALRWLVICRKRLDEKGIQASLVCADAEQPPFADGGFSHVVATDLVEHVHSVDATIRQCWSQLEAGGQFWLSATNRYCIGPHPVTRIWGIGYLPETWRRVILLKLRGVDSLRHTNLVSPTQIRQLCRQAGFLLLESGPRKFGTEKISTYPLHDRVLMRLYRLMLKFALFRVILQFVGPAFEMFFTKVEKTNNK